MKAAQTLGLDVAGVDLLRATRGPLVMEVNASPGLEGVEKTTFDDTAKDYCMIKYLLEDAKLEKLMEQPSLYRTPIVRNGRQATVGYCPEIWKQWEEAERHAM